MLGESQAASVGGWLGAGVRIISKGSAVLVVQEGLHIDRPGTWAETVGMAGGSPSLSLSLSPSTCLPRAVVTVHTRQLASPRGNTSPKPERGDLVHGWGLLWRCATTGIYKPSIFSGLIRDASFLVGFFGK